GPVDPVQQLQRRDPERAGDLDQGVDPGDAVAALDQADLGSVQRGADGQLLLRHRRPFAGTAQVLAKAPCDFFRLLFVLRHSGSLAYETFGMTDNCLYSEASASSLTVSRPSVRTDGCHSSPASRSSGLIASEPASLTRVSARAIR